MGDGHVLRLGRPLSCHSTFDIAERLSRSVKTRVTKECQSKYNWVIISPLRHLGTLLSAQSLVPGRCPPTCLIALLLPSSAGVASP